MPAVAAIVGLTAAACGAGAEQESESLRIEEPITGLVGLVDSTPGPFGDDLWFVAQDRLYSSDRAAPQPTVRVQGAPLVAPRGVAFGLGVGRVFVADPDVAGGGAIVAVETQGFAAEALPATLGYGPRAVDVDTDGVRERLVFVGRSPGDGRGRAFALDLDLDASAAVVDLAPGTSFERPDGIHVAGDGAIYVADAGTGDRTCGVTVIEGGAARPLAGGFACGAPAGISSFADGSTVLVSAYGDDGASGVVAIEAATGAWELLALDLGGSRYSGGVHRGRHVEVLSWAGGEKVGVGSKVVTLTLTAAESGVDAIPCGGCLFDSAEACLAAGCTSVFAGTCCG